MTKKTLDYLVSHIVLLKEEKKKKPQVAQP